MLVGAVEMAVRRGGTGRWRQRLVLLLIGGCALALVGVVGPRCVAILMRLPGDPAVTLVAAGNRVHPFSYERSLGSRERALAIRLERRDLVDLALLRMQQAGALAVDDPAHAAVLRMGLAALEQSLVLSPAQPIAWLLRAGIHYEMGDAPAAAQALRWSLGTGHFIKSLAAQRTVVGIGVWPYLEAPMHRLLAPSVVTALAREPEIVAWAAVAAAVEDAVEACLAGVAPDGAAQAASFRVAIAQYREAHGLPPRAMANGTETC